MMAMVATSASACAAARLRGGDVGRGEATRRGAKQVQRPEDAPAQAQREGMGGAKAGVGGDRREPRPAIDRPGHVVHLHRLAAAVALEAWALGVLDLEELEDLHRLAGGGHELEPAPLVGEQEARGSRVEQLDAPLTQARQQIDHVEVLHERVGQLDEGLC
jgi:hypothetical protein